MTGKRTKDLLSGKCMCDDCQYERGEGRKKFKCVDCLKIKKAVGGEPYWENYKDRHGPLCKECEDKYGGFDT